MLNFYNGRQLDVKKYGRGKALTVCFVWAILWILHVDAFTLENARRYADAHIELPPLEGTYSAFNPDYSAWYATHKASGLTKFLEMVHLKTPDWSVKQYTKLLQSVLKQRLADGYTQTHDLLVRPSEGSKFLIVGPLYGSFHSLVRILEEWKKKNYISSEFKLLRPDMYVVFLGNVIDGSPFILETLTLVLSLMEANPKKVLYLQGQHEYADYWQGYGLNKELELRADAHSLKPLMSQFFSTLSPLLFIQGPKDVILMAARLDRSPFLSESCRKKVQNIPFGTLISCPHSKISETPVKALFTGEDRLMSYSKHSGLVIAPSQAGALTWALFSAPNRIYRQDFKFYYDAYAVLEIGPSLAQSVLSLYNQDVREQTGFKEEASYAPLAGKSLVAAPRGLTAESLISDASLNYIERCRKTKPLERIVTKQATENPIFIGCTLDLTKGASAIGKHLKAGIALCMNRVNLRGGINGRPVQVVFMDDEYVPEKARANVESFMKTYKSTLFLCNLGSPTTESYLDLMRSNKIFVFFPATGAPLFRKPDLPGVVHWRASFESEARMLTQYMYKEQHITKFGFLYQNDSFGTGGLEGAKKFLAQAKLQPGLEIPYERNTTSFKPQIEKIKTAGVSGIGFFATSIASAEFIRQAGVDFFIGKGLFGLSDLGEQAFTKFSDQLGLNVVTAQFVPNPQTSEIQIVREYRQLLYKQGYAQEDIFELEGFIGAQVAVDILRKAAPTFSHAAIIKVLERMKGYHYKGLTFTFDPNTKEIAHLLWLDTGGPAWIEQKLEAAT